MSEPTRKPAVEPEDFPSVQFETFKRDVICSLCGSWKSEHDYSVCSEPNYLADDGDPA